jgi:hypothetical protein
VRTVLIRFICKQKKAIPDFTIWDNLAILKKNEIGILELPSSTTRVKVRMIHALSVFFALVVSEPK